MDRQDELDAIEAYVARRGVKRGPAKFVAPVRSGLPPEEERRRIKRLRVRKLTKRAGLSLLRAGRINGAGVMPFP